MSVLRIKNEITGEWQNVPFISSGGSSAPSEFGTIIEGDNIEVKKVGDDVKISAIVPTLISQLQNDLGYQTLTDVMGVIAYAVNSVLPTMTQAEYDALGTKDENLFYMIVEE